MESQFVVQVTFTTSTPTETLSATCPPTDGGTSPPLPPSDGGTSTPSNTSVFIGNSTSTLPDGSVVTTLVTETSTQWALIPTDPGQSGQSSGDSSHIKLAPIIGGALGGLVGLILIAVLGWSIW